MRRIQFIELHEQPWFPSSIRDAITDALQFGLNLVKAYAPIAPLLQSAVDASGSRSIVDMCSGGGGPWLDLSQKLHGNAPALHIWLTDKYPNLRAIQNMRSVSENHITFYPDPVDAMKVPGELKGFRTMFTSFHHFLPEVARAILQDAVDASQGIGIFEATRRAPLRTYRPQELRDIVEKLHATKYQWQIGEHSEPGEATITYLIGYPRVPLGDLPTPLAAMLGTFAK